jgi:hypothetical protein
MELRLNNNDRLTLRWARPGLLNIELWRIGASRDKPWTLYGAALLSGRELEQFLAGIQPASVEEKN